MAEEKSDSQFNLDGILSELGSFGKYQVLLLLLLGFRDSFLNMCNYNYVFTATEVDFRCEVPECERSDARFNASWTQYALTNKTNTCYRIAPNYNNSSEYHNNTCLPGNFEPSKTIPCERIVYEDYNSIVAEFDLGCQPWKRVLIGTTHNLGLIFSFVIYGFISDRYGRKVIIVITPLAVGVIGLLKSFSVNYWMLLFFEFMESALGYGNASMVLSLETVSQNSRVVFTCISDSLANFGAAFFGLIAWKLPYWRHLTRAIYSPLLVVVFYIFLVDEGVRWLLAHNKKDEAVRILNKVAKINNIKLSNKAKAMLVKVSEERQKVDEKMPQQTQPEKPDLISALRSKKILFRVALISASLFCGMFVFTGTIVNSTNILGNKYMNFSALMLVAIPTRIITAITLTKFGRRAPICIAYCLCAMFFIASAVLPKSISWWWSMALYLAGKMCSTFALFSMLVVAMEVFPTTSRNSLTNLAATFGRMGSVLAPQAPLLDKYMSGLPSIAFGLASLGSAALATLLPDASRSALPERVHDAERIDDPVADDPERSDDATAAADDADTANEPDTRIDVSQTDSKPIWTTSLDLRTEPEVSEAGCSR